MLSRVSLWVFLLMGIVMTLYSQKASLNFIHLIGYFVMVGVFFIAILYLDQDEDRDK